MGAAGVGWHTETEHQNNKKQQEMSTQTNYERIEQEWSNMGEWLEFKSNQPPGATARMSSWLEENGHIAKQRAGQPRGQAYIRYIQMNSKINQALTTGEKWEGYVARMVAEARLKKEKQKQTGQAKVLLAPTKPGEVGEARAPREVRETSSVSSGGSKKARTQPNAEELDALLAFLADAEEAAEAAGHEMALARLRGGALLRCREMLEKMSKTKAAWAARVQKRRALAFAKDEPEAEEASEAEEEEEEEEEAAPPPPAPPASPKKGLNLTTRLKVKVKAPAKPFTPLAIEPQE